MYFIDPKSCKKGTKLKSWFTRRWWNKCCIIFYIPQHVGNCLYIQQIQVDDSYWILDYNGNITDDFSLVDACIEHMNTNAICSEGLKEHWWGHLDILEQNLTTLLLVVPMLKIWFSRFFFLLPNCSIWVYHHLMYSIYEFEHKYEEFSSSASKIL